MRDKRRRREEEPKGRPGERPRDKAGSKRNCAIAAAEEKWGGNAGGGGRPPPVLNDVVGGAAVASISRHHLPTLSRNGQPSISTEWRAFATSVRLCRLIPS